MCDEKKIKAVNSKGTNPCITHSFEVNFFGEQWLYRNNTMEIKTFGTFRGDGPFGALGQKS